MQLLGSSPDALVGQWQLRRRLVDRVAAAHGTVTGTLTLARNGEGIDWQESGMLRWLGGAVAVTRRYLLRETDGRWWVRFDDGRPFHPWTRASPSNIPAEPTSTAA